MDPAQIGIVESVDRAFLFIVGISVVFLLGITATMIAFVIKYSRKRNPRPTQIPGSVTLEVIWTAVPTLLVLAMFGFGYQGFALMRQVPEDAFSVEVTARMWDWSFRYPNGKETDKLFVPLDRPISLTLTSVDVIHSFYLPAFRVKEDVIPGQETFLWFKPQSLGPADIFCAEYCGSRHAYMLSQVMVMEPEEFREWYEGDDPEAPVTPETEASEILDRHGCLRCHSLDPAATARGILPLRGIPGRLTRVTRGGETLEITADEEYLRRAIREPAAEILEGQVNIMPVPEELTDQELDQLVAFLMESAP